MKAHGQLSSLSSAYRHSPRRQNIARSENLAPAHPFISTLPENQCLLSFFVMDSSWTRMPALASYTFPCKLGLPTFSFCPGLRNKSFNVLWLIQLSHSLFRFKSCTYSSLSFSSPSLSHISSSVQTHPHTNTSMYVFICIIAMPLPPVF